MPASAACFTAISCSCAVSLKNLRNHHIEKRNKEHGQERADEHPPEYGRADGALAGRTCTAGNIQGNHAQNKGERGHDNRTETQAGGFQSSFDRAFPLRLKVFGKFDNQNRVFALKPITVTKPT